MNDFTKEQLKAFDLARTQSIVNIQSYPGTGKTFFLKQGLLQGKFEVQFGGVYVTFNKTRALDAQRMFDESGLGKHIRCQTTFSIMNQLARKTIYSGTKLLNVSTHINDLVNKESNVNTWKKKLASVLPLTLGGIPIENFPKKFWPRYIQAVNEVMLLFCASTDKHVQLKHAASCPAAVSLAKSLSVDLDEFRFPEVTKEHYCKSVNNLESLVPLQHAVYTKEIQLVCLNGDEPSKILNHIDACTIFIDESQDLSSCVQYIFNKFAKINRLARILRVYDINQSIYMFTNSTTSVHPIGDIQFTQTFRFGKNIASVANLCLQLIRNTRDHDSLCHPDDVDARYQIKGNKFISDIVDIGSKSLLTLGPELTSIAQFEDLLVISRQRVNPAIHALSLLPECTSETPSFGYTLFGKDEIADFHAIITVFKQALTICANGRGITNVLIPLSATDNSDVEIENRILLKTNMDNVDERIKPRYLAIRAAIAMYRSDPDSTFVDTFARCAQLLEGRIRRDITFRVGTAHRYKGEESEIVFLMDGFCQIFDAATNKINPNLTEEELYVLFVALTRAKKYLFLTSAMKEDFDRLQALCRSIPLLSTHEPSATPIKRKLDDASEDHSATRRKLHDASNEQPTTPASVHSDNDTVQEEQLFSPILTRKPLMSLPTPVPFDANVTADEAKVDVCPTKNLK